VKQRIAAGDSRPEAMAACVLEQSAPTTTERPNGGGGLTPDDPDTTAASGDDGGTSVGLLLAVGVAGVVLGAALAIMLRKRTDGGATAPGMAPGYGTSPAPVAPPPMFTAPGTAPGTMGAPAAPDRSPGLVTSLVDLSDRVSSGALRAEILAALARAGVHAVEPAQGDIFDVNRMRGVGSAPAPDPSWVGRVAGTERAGFQDGGVTVRPPEVIVFTAGG
jgi:hypothetical protein